MLEWLDSCTKSFKKIKEMMTSDQVLVHYDPEKPVALVTDGSHHPMYLEKFYPTLCLVDLKNQLYFHQRTLTPLRKSIHSLTRKRLESCGE